MDGDPSNNDYFGLMHEWGMHEITLRSGGDAAGLMSNRSLDYLQAMGYTCIYIAGTPFLNMPWQADSTFPFPRPRTTDTLLTVQVIPSLISL